MRLGGLLAAACCLCGCLERKAAGGGAVFAHTWGSLILVLIAFAACAALGILLFTFDDPISRRGSALLLMGAVMIGIVVLPGWTLDRVALDQAGVKLRVVRQLKIQRYEKRWDRLQTIRVGSSGNDRYVSFTEQGRLADPFTVLFDRDTVDAILPDLARLSQAAGVWFETNL